MGTVDLEVRASGLLLRRGPFAMQEEEAAMGLELWAHLDRDDLELIRDPSPDSVDRGLLPMAPG